jgi:membrane protease YdiL (CAAX protease family)
MSATTEHRAHDQRAMGAASALPEEPPRRAAGILIAWTVTVAVSQAPYVLIAQALGLPEAAVDGLWLGAAVVLVAVCGSWSRARSLLPYATVLLAVVALIGVVLPLIGGWLPLDGQSDLVQALGRKAVFFAGAVVMAIVLARTAGSRQTTFIAAGDLRASTSLRFRVRGRRLSWAVIGPAAAVLLFCLFAGVLIADGVFDAGDGARLLEAAPLILVCAAFNAFGEEVIHRAGPLSRLVGIVGPGHAVAMTAVWFGLGHYAGSIPSGIEGVVASALLGLLLGRAMLATRGLGWPVVIHIAVDIVVFATIAVA